ncbi:hypothetical protein T484DRAFT_1783169 [Baffinella frigidus]|nr:hypothetical protein T484DRAFT_1783169 [Cryptophyta sp. CCMP2293]
MHTAIQMRRPEIVKLLIEKGADINLGAKDGTTPLAFAFELGLLQTVDTLVKAGAKWDTTKGSVA